MLLADRFKACVTEHGQVSHGGFIIGNKNHSQMQKLTSMGMGAILPQCQQRMKTSFILCMQTETWENVPVPPSAEFLHPRLHSFLLSLVREVLRRNDETDQVNAVSLEKPEAASLQALGYIKREGQLSKEAFFHYFDLVPSLAPPPEAQTWCSEFGLEGIQWKIARGPLKRTSRAFICLNIIVIRLGSPPSTWLHELAHLAFSRIPKALVANWWKRPARTRPFTVTASRSPLLNPTAEKKQFFQQAGI